MQLNMSFGNIVACVVNANVPVCCHQCWEHAMKSSHNIDLRVDFCLMHWVGKLAIWVRCMRCGLWAAFSFDSYFLIFFAYMELWWVILILWQPLPSRTFYPIICSTPWFLLPNGWGLQGQNTLPGQVHGLCHMDIDLSKQRAHAATEKTFNTCYMLVQWANHVPHLPELIAECWHNRWCELQWQCYLYDPAVPWHVRVEGEWKGVGCLVFLIILGVIVLLGACVQK